MTGKKAELPEINTIEEALNLFYPVLKGIERITKEEKDQVRRERFIIRRKIRDICLEYEIKKRINKQILIKKIHLLRKRLEAQGFTFLNCTTCPSIEECEYQYGHLDTNSFIAIKLGFWDGKPILQVVTDSYLEGLPFPEISSESNNDPDEELFQLILKQYQEEREKILKNPPGVNDSSPINPHIPAWRRR